MRKPTSAVEQFDFFGESFDEKQDGERLRTQLQRVQTYMDVGWWRTLAEIKAVAGGTEASISARLRDLRKAPFFLSVERHRVPDGNGLHEYRVVRKDSLYPD